MSVFNTLSACHHRVNSRHPMLLSRSLLLCYAWGKRHNTTVTTRIVKALSIFLSFERRLTRKNVYFFLLRGGGVRGKFLSGKVQGLFTHDDDRKALLQYLLIVRVRRIDTPTKPGQNYDIMDIQLRTSSRCIGDNMHLTLRKKIS